MHPRDNDAAEAGVDDAEEGDESKPDDEHGLHLDLGELPVGVL